MERRVACAKASRPGTQHGQLPAETPDDHHAGQVVTTELSAHRPGQLPGNPHWDTACSVLPGSPRSTVYKALWF